MLLPTDNQITKFVSSSCFYFKWNCFFFFAEKMNQLIRCHLIVYRQCLLIRMKKMFDKILFLLLNIEKKMCYSFGWSVFRKKSKQSLSFFFKIWIASLNRNKSTEIEEDRFVLRLIRATSIYTVVFLFVEMNSRESNLMRMLKH